MILMSRRDCSIFETDEKQLVRKRKLPATLHVILIPRSGSAIDNRGRTYAPDLNAWASRSLRFPNLVAHPGIFSLLTPVCYCAPWSGGQLGLDTEANTPSVFHREPVNSTHAGTRTILFPGPNDKAGSELDNGQMTQANLR